jgi:hypothetical protein
MRYRTEQRDCDQSMNDEQSGSQARPRARLVPPEAAVRTRNKEYLLMLIIGRRVSQLFHNLFDREGL